MSRIRSVKGSDFAGHASGATSHLVVYNNQKILTTNMVMHCTFYIGKLLLYTDTSTLDIFIHE
jgi:hypothetical protein